MTAAARNNNIEHSGHHTRATLTKVLNCLLTIPASIVTRGYDHIVCLVNRSLPQFARAPDLRRCVFPPQLHRRGRFRWSSPLFSAAANRFPAAARLPAAAGADTLPN